MRTSGPIRQKRAPHLLLSQPALDHAANLADEEVDEYFVLHLMSPFVYIAGDLNSALVLVRDTPYSLRQLAEINSVNEWQQGRRIYKVVYERAWTSREILELLVSYFVFSNKMYIGLDIEQKTFVFCYVQEYNRRYSSS